MTITFFLSTSITSIFIKGQNSHHINYFNHNNITNIHNNNSNNTNNYSSSQYNLSACQEHYFDEESNFNFKTDFHQNIYFPSQNMNNITSNNDNHDINNDIHSHNDNSFDYDCFLEFFQNNSTMKIVILENFNPSLNINLIDFFISHNCSIVIVMHEIYGLIQKLSKNIIISCINFSSYSRNQLIDILIEKMGGASSLVSNTVLSYVAQRTVSCGGSVPEAIELLIVICRNAILNGRKRVNDVNLNAHEKEERILRNC
ncbi:hypothetical protein TRFO_32000 [Tritrichomonas foetus]|uniref:Uncharacterized protein n=1 Tax=Tritrichomonas foetus TaxID=1144522 RepID=A0A1J4JR67_9EUKA|nr:hypothetical protein TRFO_32000 [Tritrichomonas foetus]|eukprot:OHT01250.1 hypothetical protein TRFO_32000 [Tritrichomonas foetus]